MIEEPARVRLDLQASPENVTLVRAVLAGFAQALSLSAEWTMDLQTAISEACNNVVMHAYPDGPGTMTLTLEAWHDHLSATVSDCGRGITRIATSDERMGLGLAIISALADRSEFLTPKGGGTEVRMHFDRDTAARLSDHRPAGNDYVNHQLSGDVVAWISPVALTRFVLGRILRTVAAGSYFSVTRLLDLSAVNDAIAQYAELVADGSVGVAIQSSKRRLSLTGGPFSIRHAGAGDGAVVTPEAARELRTRREALNQAVDTISSEDLHDSELLHMVVLDAERTTEARPS